MTLSNLISKVLDFVNLGKAVVDGAPGVVLAVALSIFAASVAELPIFPYTHGPVELVQVPEEAAPGQTGTAAKAPEAADAASTAQGSGSPGSPDEQQRPRLEEQLEELGRQIQTNRQEVVTLSGDKAEADAKVEALKGELQQLDTQLEKLREERDQRIQKDALGFGPLESRIKRVDDDRRRTKKDLEEALKEQSSLQNQLDDQKAEVDRFLTEFKALSQERITTLRGLFAYLLDHLIGLALIGWVLGTMLSPLNRALLVLGTQGGLESQTKGAIEHYDRMRPQSESLSSDEKKGLQKLLGHRSASFFIGRKIIAKAEWDEIVTSYYRWAEAANNLIIPLTVLGLSLLWLEPPATPNRPVLFAVVAGSVILALAVLAASQGRLLFENDSTPTEDGPTVTEAEHKRKRRIVSIGLAIAFIALLLIAWQLYGHRYTLASVLCWLLAFVAWFQGRKAFFLYRRRGADFILGRLIATELAKKEKSSAQSLEEVTKQTVASFKGLLDELKKRDERVAKELIAKVTQLYESKSGNAGE